MEFIWGVPSRVGRDWLGIVMIPDISSTANMKRVRFAPAPWDVAEHAEQLLGKSDLRLATKHATPTVTVCLVTGTCAEMDNAQYRFRASFWSEISPKTAQIRPVFGQVLAALFQHWPNSASYFQTWTGFVKVGQRLVSESARVGRQFGVRFDQRGPTIGKTSATLGRFWL